MSKTYGSIGLLGALLFVVGCGSQERSATAPTSESPGRNADDRLGVKQEAPAAGRGEKAADAKGEPAAVQRRIIYTATLDMLVADFDKARKVLENLIEESEAYVAKSEFTGNIGARRTGTWTIRVPVARFHSFVNAVTTLGQPQRHSTEAQDVTEEYVDVQALIKNLKEEEETLNRLLKEQAKSFADIQSWREKIALVRRDIARYEARLQTLGRLTAMSTVYVTLRDEKEYVPETSPKYGATAGRTFDDSWKALKDVAQGIFIVLVALVPWLPLILVVSIVTWRVWKHYAKKNRPASGPESGERLVMP